MKPRERVAAALGHERPDRPPFQATFAPELAARLRDDLELDPVPRHNPFGAGNPHDLEVALGEDLLLTSVGWTNSFYARGDDDVDEWGVGWRAVPFTTPHGDGHYPEAISHPLASKSGLSSYRPPDPSREQLYAHATHTLFGFHDTHFIVGSAMATIFDTAWALRGLEQLLMDFVEDPDLAEEILDIPYRYHRFAAERLTRMGVDMIFIGDDVAHQSGMLMSPTHWRRFLKPRYAALITSLQKINREIRIAFHSDGAIEAIVADLVEIGVDVLHPVQPSAMDPVALRRQYGSRLSLWGTLDEQQTLPFGTPQDVRQEVRERVADVGADGGLIVGPTHHLGIDVPLENVWAMVEAATGSRPR